MTQLDTATNVVDQVRRSIHDYIVANFLFGADELDDSASLLEEGLIDSMGVLELVLFLEEEFDISIADDEVLPELFESVNTLAVFAARRVP